MSKFKSIDSQFDKIFSGDSENVEPASDSTNNEDLGRRVLRPRKERPKLVDEVIIPNFTEIPEVEKDVIFKPTILVENQDNQASGDQVFKFNTPKKRGGMLEKALNSPRTPRNSAIKRQAGTPRTPKGSAYKSSKDDTSPKTPRGSALRRKAETPKTPKGSILKQSNAINSPRTPRSTVKFAPETPKSGLKGLNNTPSRRLTGTPSRRVSTLIAEETTVPQTPESVKRSVRQRIRKIKCDADDSDSEEELKDSDDDSNYSDELSSDEEDDDDDDIEDEETEESTCTDEEDSSGGTPVHKQHQRVRRTKSARTPRTEINMVADVNDYFSYNNHKAVTSDHTLSRLDTPKLSTENLRSLLRELPDGHESERGSLLDDQLSCLSHWMTLLCEGFSLFLTGVGSKKHLMTCFQEDYLENIDHIVVNGFFPSLTLKSILSTIIEDIIGSKQSYSAVQDCVDVISKAYSSPSCSPLFLIIHNLDGPMLRSEKTQMVLSQLAAVPHIHLIASFDHINAPLIMDVNKISNYNPIWWDATTLAPYIEETSYENSLLVQQSGALALSSLIHIFLSLTPNAKKIFTLIAKHELQNKENSSYSGLSFTELYQRCREEFLVNSDLTLRAQLTEFHDHKLIKSKKGIDGIENIVICLDKVTLAEFISQQEEE